jgi:hypothetical protein
MKKLWKYVAIIVLIGIVIAIAVSLFVFRKADDSVAKQQPDFKVTCTEIVSAFEKDEPQANEKYLDKILEVEGTIAELSSDTSGVNITLREEGATSGVTCSFSTSQKIDIKELKLGSKLTFKGICNGYLMDVTLNRGAIVK